MLSIWLGCCLLHLTARQFAGWVVGFIGSTPKGGEVLVCREVDVGALATAIWRVCGSSAKAEWMWSKDPLLGYFSALEKISGHAWFVFYQQCSALASHILLCLLSGTTKPVFHFTEQQNSCQFCVKERKSWEYISCKKCRFNESFFYVQTFLF